MRSMTYKFEEEDNSVLMTTFETTMCLLKKHPLNWVIRSLFLCGDGKSPLPLVALFKYIFANRYVNIFLEHEGRCRISCIQCDHNY